MGHHDPEAAAIEKSAGKPVLHMRNPRDRGDAGTQGGDRDLNRRIEAHGIVLKIDEQPVISASFHNRSNIHATRMSNPNTERKVSSIEAFFLRRFESLPQISLLYSTY